MIRKFEPRDIEQVMRIWLAGNIEAHGFIPREYWEGNLPFVREALLQAEVYVFETGGAVRGFAGLQGDYLAGIFVESGFRSMGAGRQLLEHVKGLHAALSLHVYQKNSRAAAFYRREGFSAAAVAVDRESGEADAAMVWSRAEKPQSAEGKERDIWRSTSL